MTVPFHWKKNSLQTGKLKKKQTGCFCLYSIYISSNILKTYLTQVISINTREWSLTTKIEKILEPYFALERKELARIYLNEDINSNDWKELSRQLIFNELIKNRQATYDEIKCDLIEKIQFKLSAIDNTTNTKYLNKLITEQAIVLFNNTDLFRIKSFSEQALEESAWWKNFELLLKKEIETYKGISTKINDNAITSPKKLRVYFKKTVELDRLIFDKRHEEYSKGKPYESPAANGSQDREKYLVIPTVPGTSAAVEMIDRLRRRALPYIRGNENALFIKNLDIKFKSIIAHQFNDAAKKIAAGEERLRLSKHQGKDTAFKNISDFRKAQKTYNSNHETVEKYREISIDFIQWATGARHINPDRIVDMYIYSVGMQKEYLMFIQDLTKNGAGAASLHEPQINQRYVIAIRGSAGFFKDAILSPGISREQLALLNRAQVQKFKNIKSRFTSHVVSLKQEIRNIYTGYTRQRSLALSKEKEGKENLRNTIVQHEINLITKYINNYMKLYHNMDYAGEAFALYNIKYSEMSEKAKEGEITDELEMAIGRRSIIQATDFFDQKRINSELSAKTIIKKEVLSDISRLVTLIDFYRRSGVKIMDHPSLSELESIKRDLSKVCHVKIGPWIMNENNFEKIDRNAVLMLSVVLKKNSGGKNNIQAIQNDNNMKLKIKSIMSFSVPPGWQEDRTGDMDRYRGVFKTFYSMKGEAKIEMIKLKTSSKGLREISEDFIKGNKLTMVKNRWGTKDSNDYLWILSHDRDKNIMETYSISGEDHVLIIFGKTTRQGYQSFKDDIKSFFSSIDF